MFEPTMGVEQEDTDIEHVESREEYAENVADLIGEDNLREDQGVRRGEKDEDEDGRTPFGLGSKVENEEDSDVSNQQLDEGVELGTPDHLQDQRNGKDLLFHCSAVINISVIAFSWVWWDCAVVLTIRCVYLMNDLVDLDFVVRLAEDVYLSQVQEGPSLEDYFFGLVSLYSEDCGRLSDAVDDRE